MGTVYMGTPFENCKSSESWSQGFGLWGRGARAGVGQVRPRVGKTFRFCANLG